MILHVIFTAEGIPAHISTDPRPGSEPVEGLDIAFLVSHRRTEKGDWVPRDPIAVPPPGPEEIAALRQAEHEAAVLVRDEAVRDALAREADPMFFRWQRDECSREDWLATVAAVKARFPKPVLD
jgi:hypothetical protein